MQSAQIADLVGQLDVGTPSRHVCGNRHPVALARFGDDFGFGFNAVTGDFSRGAAGFLIEDGELTRPINEVTISLPLDDLLQRIDAVADDLDQRTAIATPTFRVSSMTVAGR